MKHLFKYSIVAVVLSLLLSAPARSQQPSPYPDTMMGLHHFLEDGWTAAQQPDQDNLAAFIRNLELPDPDQWSSAAFDPDTGTAWMDFYRTNVAASEDALRALFLRVASQDGDFVTQKMGDAASPRGPAPVGSSYCLLQPADIYFAGWRSATPGNGQSAFVGFFIFIDGNFRYLPGVVVATSRCLTRRAPRSLATGQPPDGDAGGAPPSGVANGSFPTCLYCPIPSYSDEARKEKLQGAVFLSVVVQPDGSPTDVKISRGLGNALDDLAIAAVQNWRFHPALGPDGQPIAATTPVEITFHLLK